MDPKRLLLGVVLVCSAASAATTRPAEIGAPEPNEKDLAGQLRELVPMLPSVMHKVTDNFRETGEKACAAFRAGYKQRDKLDEEMRGQLGLVGLHGGYTAGDADTMLQGAKLLLAGTKRIPAGSKKAEAEDYAWYALAWAAIFKGEAETAEKALKHLVKHARSNEMWSKWAGGMLPIAKQFGRQVHLTIGVVDGKRMTTSGLRGQAVLLEFGAGKADPWVKNLMALKMFHTARKDDKHFTMIGICMDGSAEAAKETAKKHEIPWPLVASMELRARFLGEGLPYAVVLSPTGHIIWQGHPGVLGNLSRAVDFARRQAALMAKTGVPPTASAPADDAETLARRKYRLAKTYRDAGLADKGRAVLAEIVRKYPQTTAAAEARKLLAEKPKP